MMQGGNERKQQQLSFQRSLRSVDASRSFRASDSISNCSSSHSSALLELLCKGIITSPNEDDGDSLNDILLNDDLESNNLVNSLAELLLPSKTNNKNTSSGESIVYGNSEERLPEAEETVKEDCDFNSSSPIITPKTHKKLKSILRNSCRSEDQIVENGTPSTLQSFYLPRRTSASASKLTRIPTEDDSNNQTVTCLVSTKDYDGERKEPSLDFSREEQSSYIHDCPSIGEEHNCSMDGINQLLQNELQIEAHAKVADMEWIETIRPYRRGYYSGIVDQKMRPHGLGSWIIRNGEDDGCVKIKLHGWWYEGSFIPQACIDRTFNIPHDCKVVDEEDVATKSISIEQFPLPPFSKPPEDQNGGSRYHQQRLPSQEEYAADNCQDTETEYRHHYKLGETLHSQDDIVDVKADKGHTHLRMISELQANDGAFIKRSIGGTFTYAFVTDRRYDPKSRQETLKFLVNTSGAKKIIPERKWKSCIRVEQPRQYFHEEDSSHNSSSPRCVRDSINLTWSEQKSKRPIHANEGKSISSLSSDLSCPLQVKPGAVDELHSALEGMRSGTIHPA